MILHLAGTVNEEMYMQVVEFLEEAKGRDVQIAIHSAGGDHMDSLAIFNALRLYPGKVTTIAMGQVQSAAVLIYAAGDVRNTAQYNWFMVHEDTGELSDSVSGLRRETAQLIRLEDEWARLMEDRTGTEAKHWTQLSDSTTYLDSEEARELGLAHEIIRGIN